MYPDHSPTPSCAGNLARPPWPENSSLRSRYARHNATGFVEHLVRPDHAREGHILALSGITCFQDGPPCPTHPYMVPKYMRP